MSDFLNEFLPDLEAFRDKTMKFHNGEIKVPEYKGFSGGFGSYAQRGAKTHMLRLRMAGGRLTKERMRTIIDICEKYSVQRMKLTTCQSIQLHDLEAAELCEMMEDAWTGGMISRGGGGDFPRNVMMSPLSGVEQGEFMDVVPYVEAAGEYLMNFIKGPKFPRKLKVCFSNSKENVPHATFRDMGFVAREDQKFDLYIAGGLGNKPMLGVKVAEAIEPSKIFYYLKAMVETFLEHGNYENRGRARTRFMQENLGVDGLKAAYYEKLTQIFETEHLEFDLETYKKRVPDATAKVVDESSDAELLKNSRVVAQKQQGLYAVSYQPIGGILTPERLKALYELVKDMEYVELRITPEEGVYMINCNAKEAQRILEATSDSAGNLFETSVACVGNKTCQVGVGDSQGLLQLCVEAVRKENFADGVLPKIHISGCPSSCAAHQIGEIGFRGAVKQTPDGPKPAFAISVGGCALQGQEVIAEVGKAIIVEEIPLFLVELGKMISDEGMTYQTWIPKHQEKLEQLIEKYTA